MTEGSDISKLPDENNDEEKHESENQVLSKIVPNPAQFAQVQEVGALKMDDLDSDTELYIFTVPNAVINNFSLVNTNVVIGGKKGRDLTVGNKEYKVESYKNLNTDTGSSLFLPDRFGEVRKVDFPIMGHVIVKEQPQNLSKSLRIDVDSMRQVKHKPPVDIKERNFLSTSGTTTVRKDSNKLKRAAPEEQDDESPVIHKKKKKKKKKEKEVLQDYDEVSQTVDHLAVSEQLVDTEVVKKKKKKKKDKDRDLEI